MNFEKKDIPKKSESLAEWYNKVVLAAELADYGPAKGTMIFRPYGYAIWESIQKELDERIKKKGVENAYFPMFIPETLLNREKSHIEGFSPELAVVTIGGGEELQERLVIRPTSETIIYDAFNRWIHSWRDLPMQINQWSNVVRWEKRTYLFLRTSEFLWQEGHTAHATHEEAKETQGWAMEMYRDAYQGLFAIPGRIGYKSESEKFAGADSTWTYEALMPSGKALQSCTSHDLGQNFSKAFDITFQDKEGKNDYVWQTSWGLSTRSLGALIMMHGDDNGLRLPPRIAPTQVVIVPVKQDEDTIRYCQSISESLQNNNIRVKLDTRENESFGYKINKWELRGVPIRLEVGPKEVASNSITLARRDNMKKYSLSIEDNFVALVKEELEKIQDNLYKQAEGFLTENTREAKNYNEFKQLMLKKKGFILVFWCEDQVCETQIKEETKATTRCMPFDSDASEGACIKCGKPGNNKWLFAQAY